MALGAIRAVRRAGLSVPARRLGGRLRRLRPHELHRPAADDRPPADRADGRAGSSSCWRQIDGGAVPPTSCSSSPSSWSAARPRPRRPRSAPAPRPRTAAIFGPAQRRLRHLRSAIAAMTSCRMYLQRIRQALAFDCRICAVSSRVVERCPTDPRSDRTPARIRHRRPWRARPLGAASRARRRRAGGATRSSTRSTSAASPTRTATAPATSPACARTSRTCATSASTPSGSPPGTPSPLADGGYDVADYRAIDPAFGTLERGRAADRRGAARSGSARSSTSSRTTSRTSTRGSRRRSPPGPGSPERERFWFRPGHAAPDGDEPPTSWRSNFGGPAWTRTTNPDGTPGEWYLHLFAPEQPDLNWDAPGRPARARGHPPLLVRPRRRRRAHRLGGAAGQGSRRCPRSRPTRRPASTRTPTATSCTTSTARWRADRRRLPRSRASSSARSGCRTSSGSRATCGPTSCTPRSTSTSWRCPWDAGALRASIDATLAAHAPGRRARDVGALQPRRHPAGHPLRPRRHLVRVRAKRAGTPTDLALGTPPGPRRGAPVAALPARCTSTRATSSASRGRGPARRAARRTRCTSAPAASTRAATAAGCRCRGPATSRRSGSARPARRAEPWLAPAGRLGGADRRRPEPRIRLDAQPLPRRRCASAGTSPASGDGPLRWLPIAPTASWPSRAATFRLRSSTSAGRRSRCRPTRDVLLASDDARWTAACRRDTTVWLRRTARGEPDPECRDAITSRPDHRNVGSGPTRQRVDTMSGAPCDQVMATAAVAAVGERSLPRDHAVRGASVACRRVERAASARPRAAAAGPVTISVASLIPGATQEATDAFNHQVSEFEQANTLDITVKSDEYHWTGPDLRRQARGRHAADRLHHPVHRRQAARPERPARQHHRRSQGAAVRRQVQPERAGRRPGRRTARSTRCRPPAYGMALHYNRDAVHAGRPRSRQAADHLGRGRRPTPRPSPTKTGVAGFAEMAKTTTPAAGC